MENKNALVERIKSEYINGTEYEDCLAILFDAQFTWESILNGILSILSCPAEDKALYQYCADMIWCAVSEEKQLGNQKDLTIALLYFRLGNAEDPYDNNTLWSIVSKVNQLDYANSEYNPLKDETLLQLIETLDAHK